MTSESVAMFQDAANRAKQFRRRPTDDELLQLYALYKQAVVGKCNVPKPGMFAFKERAKHSAWEALGAMPSEEARRRYIVYVNQLVQRYG